MILFAIGFGTLVRQELVGTKKAGWLSKTALFLAEMPVNFRLIFNKKDAYIADRHKHLNKGFNIYSDQVSYGSNKSVYLLLSRWDGDINEGIIELIDLREYKVIHSWNPDLSSLYKVFESKKLYDNQVQNWVTERVQGAGFSIDRKSTILINEHLGNSLSKISNEIDKLFEIKEKEKIIELSDIEKYIGISKEFNNFELRRALGEKNYNKAYQIAQYFTENPSSNPLVVSISVIFDFFNKLLIYHSNSNLDDRSLASMLGVNPYFLSEYKLASSNYNLKQVVSIISLIRDYDMFSKGVGIKKSDSFLLKEMVLRIIKIN